MFYNCIGYTVATVHQFYCRCVNKMIWFPSQHTVLGGRDKKMFTVVGVSNTHNKSIATSNILYSTIIIGSDK